MRLIDIMNGLWAITPEKLDAIRDVYDAHIRREKIDIKALEADLGEKLERKSQEYKVENGVAIIPVDGVIAKKMNMMTKISGGCSTEILKDKIEDALEDYSVNAIVLDVDSGGGAVDGTPDLARFIFENRGVKPIYAIANDTMCSAAYWIASAADEVFVTKAGNVGSIGVVAQHVDVSERNKQEGIKKTEICAGRYKRITSENEPLSDEGRKTIQDSVDYVYSLFVDDIALHRGVSTDKVLKDMADGRVFIGQQAVDAGLVDGVSTLESLVSRIASGDLQNNDRKENDMANEAKDLTVEFLAENHPQVFEAIRKEGFEAGVKAETERVKSVFAQKLTGHEELIERLAFDGKTTGAEAAIQVLAAEKAKAEKMHDALKADAAEVKDIEASISEENKGFMALVDEAVASGVSRADAIVQVASQYPEIHQAYIEGDK